MDYIYTIRIYAYMLRQYRETSTRAELRGGDLPLVGYPCKRYFPKLCHYRVHSKAWRLQRAQNPPTRQLTNFNQLTTKVSYSELKMLKNAEINSQVQRSGEEKHLSRYYKIETNKIGTDTCLQLPKYHNLYGKLTANE